MAEQTRPNIARMRTRDQAIAQLRKDDPETALTRNSIDRLIKSGALPPTYIGNKILINYDTLLELLSSGDTSADPPQETAKSGTIRPVKL